MEDAVFEWTVRPYARNWRKTILLICLIIFIAGMVYYSLHDIYWVIFAVVLLLLNLINFFLPIRYIFDNEEIRVITPLNRKTKKWAIFKSFYPDNSGVLLSPFPTKSWLENFRGLYLLWGNNRAQVLEIIKHKIATQ